MRRLPRFIGLQVTNLAIKKPGSREAPPGFNIHSTYQALCARASSSSRVQYARRRYTAAHVADQRINAATLRGIVAMHHDRQRFVVPPSGCTTNWV